MTKKKAGAKNPRAFAKQSQNRTTKKRRRQGRHRAKRPSQALYQNQSGITRLRPNRNQRNPRTLRAKLKKRGNPNRREKKRKLQNRKRRRRPLWKSALRRRSVRARHRKLSSPRHRHQCPPLNQKLRVPSQVASALRL